ncbi:hypothetical protein NEOKW01_1212 [Nematocida sp. AWRm80]|nr:hypothetical protein NEOKW01_1212 [Nematocida sp. AWRm80]
MKQYILLRNDLPNYSTGSLVAQAVHASNLLFHSHSDGTLLNYLKQQYNMIVVVLQCNLSTMLTLIRRMKELGVKHSEWIEQPENEITAVAIYPLSSTDPFYKELKKVPLYK